MPRSPEVAEDGTAGVVAGVPVDGGAGAGEVLVNAGRATCRRERGASDTGFGQ